MTRLCRIVLPLLTLCLLLLPHADLHAQMQEFGDGGPGPVNAQHLTVQLVSLTPGIAPGGIAQVGLVLTLEDRWHVYWINAGDSGEAPSVKWTLPDGLTFGPMQFPVPSRLPLGPLMDFGYENIAAFPFTLTASPSLKPGPIHLDARVRWLVCREVCIPGKAHLGLDLKVVPGKQPALIAGPLSEALKRLPKPLPPASKFSVAVDGNDFILTLITGHQVKSAEFYPFDADQIANAAPQAVEPLPDGVRLRVKRSPDLLKLPDQLHGLLKLSSSESYDLSASVAPLAGSSTAAPASSPLASKLRAPAAPASKLTAFTAIGLALLGGIILNLMPCVFPVLFLKGLALVQSSGQERKYLRAHGLVYTLGILVSFWIIVAVLLALRASGSQAGWGFQLQSPTFIAILASFLFFFALSLAGQFDLGLSLTSAGGSLAQKEGYTGSFFTGVLATVVATPCTAPLMGAAIGFALAQPAPITFAIFTALGLGLALPYLLLTLQPAWTRILPRPGAWMEILKQVTAIPLFGTVIWLAWVFGSLFAGRPGESVDHVARLLWCFLILAIAGWVLSHWPARWSSALVAVVLALSAISIPLTQPKKDTLNWQPYTAAALADARTAGHPVFIDFTAAWCLSCQVNEKAVLQSAEVKKQLSAHNLTLFRADWTQYDSEITKELASVGRSGVPTYVLYPATPTANADVLPELLTKSLVLEAIERDTK